MKNGSEMNINKKRECQTIFLKKIKLKYVIIIYPLISILFLLILFRNKIKLKLFHS